MARGNRPRKGSRREDYLSARTSTSSRWTIALVILLPLLVFVAIVLLWPGSPIWGPTSEPVADGARALPVASKADAVKARFPICHGPVRVTCVVDGDTIWYSGTKIRIADIDTPETSEPGCENEARMGQRATLRLQALLNAGAFTIAPNPEGRDTDKYGRKLRLITRGGNSLGLVLVDEGLAEEWGGPRIDWCW